MQQLLQQRCVRYEHLTASPTSHSAPADADLYDKALSYCWQQLAECSFTGEAKARLGLPGWLGGCGAQFASTRRFAVQLAVLCKNIPERLWKRHATAPHLTCLLPCPSLARTSKKPEKASLNRMSFRCGATLAEMLRASSWSQGGLLKDVRKNTRQAAGYVAVRDSCPVLKR